jgi:thiol-disulfide isomerase/thioredoxin
MRIPFGSSLALILVLVCAPSAYSQDAREILTRVSETYAKLKSYDFNIEAHAVFEVEGVKYRMTMPQEMAQGDAPDESMGVLLKLPTFVRLDESDQPANPRIGFGAPDLLFYDFSRIAQNLHYAKLVREETLKSNGKSATCYVVESLRIPDGNASPRAPALTPETLWIDKTNYLVLRVAFRTIIPARESQPAVEMDWGISFISYTLNEAPPEWLLDRRKSFDQQMAKLRAKWVGTSAPDFALQDLDGHEVTLAGLRGKAILLDFWDTWCGPCRKELPVLASLEKTWSSKGLVVVRIANEPLEDIQAFLQRTRQSFPTLVNGEGVSKQFGVVGIPTLVLIDTNGKIVAYDVDALSEAQLTTRLKSAGLE